jgi:hypothetical protein
MMGRPQSLWTRIEAVLKPVGEWMAFALSAVVFGLFYWLLFAPVALVMKVRGRHFLPRFTGDEPTFFLPKDPIEPTLKWMSRQW